ncbi:MAG TPA: energy transducer TonB, partial [Cryomorphaceae bacterium]|nr:energy transducer TonB [Cryomorphaceae bacterium]
MEVKKNPKKDLENLRGLFVQAGLVFALVLVIVAIEWKTYDRTASDLGELDVQIDDEIIPITQRDLAPTPPPPPPPP